MIGLLTVEQVANQLHVTAGTVREWIRQGKLAASRMGKHYLIDEQDLRNALIPVNPKTARPHGEHLHRMRGILRGTGFSTEKFIAEKQMEIDEEERRSARNQGT